MVSAYMVWFCCSDLCFLHVELGLAVGRSDGETEESTYPEHELAVIEPMVGTNLASQKWQRLEDLIGLQIIKLFTHWCLAEAPKTSKARASQAVGDSHCHSLRGTPQQHVR